MLLHYSWLGDSSTHPFWCPCGVLLSCLCCFTGPTSNGARPSLVKVETSRPSKLVKAKLLGKELPKFFVTSKLVGLELPIPLAS